MKIMGIDMGTTTISVIMADGNSGQLLGSHTVEHHAFEKTDLSYEKIQNAEKLFQLTKEAVNTLILTYGKPDSIGMTGQMHGMLYIDKNGMAASPLFTWQDQRGNLVYKDNLTYAQYLRKYVKGAAAAGYGLTTHFYQLVNKKIPEEAAAMVTISDYVAMRLCGLTKAVIACDMAASWGCFDLEKGEFRTEELEAIGVDTSFLPEVLKSHSVIGKTEMEIPVTVSLGDNQASVLGSVQDLENTVLINIGTGSQVSFGVSKFIETQGSVELRPCTEKLYLMAGSGLCGGRAYAMLEGFYRAIVQAGCEGLKEKSIETSLYSVMSEQAQDFIQKYGVEGAWKIKTTFSGTRTNPQEKGSIEGISVENFHPGAMTVGMLRGILEELQEMYEKMCVMTEKKATFMVGSGNGIRKNPLMQQLAEELFGMKLSIPLCKEEAAYGAALQSAAASGLAASLEEMQLKIQYI